MSTPSILGSVVSAANPVTAIVGLGKDLIDRFVPDPAAKLQAQQHVLDIQAQMQEAVINQQNDIIAATSKNISSDPHMSSVRATFCYSVTALYVWNYAICRFFHQLPIPIPGTLDGMFATIMLGFVGIPSGLETMKTILNMPGTSEVSFLGVKAKNSGPTSTVVETSKGGSVAASTNG